jgi:hypothetical protein
VFLSRVNFVQSVLPLRILPAALLPSLSVYLDRELSHRLVRILRRSVAKWASVIA